MHIHHRVLLLLVLAATIGACATAGGVQTADSGPEVVELPPCALDLIAIDTTARGSRTLEEARQWLESEGWISPTTTVVQASTRPHLRNLKEVALALQAYYPPELRDRGLGGRATFAVLIDADGHPARWRLTKSAGYPQLDIGASRVVSQTKFYPATYGHCRVPHWGEIPFVFMVR